MARKLIYVLQGRYAHGWEDITAEETLTEIRQRRREYVENEGGSYRVVIRQDESKQGG